MLIRKTLRSRGAGLALLWCAACTGGDARDGSQLTGGNGATGQAGTAGAAAGSGGSATGGQGGSSGLDAGSGADSGTSDAGSVPVDAGPVDAGQADAAPPAPDCQGKKVVHFVYFVEADETYSAELQADVEGQAFAFQQYWYEQLGVTFYLNHPVVDVIEADHEADWYLTTADGIHGDARWYRLGNVKNEVYAKLGIENFDADHRVVNYPTTRYDGHVGGNFGGAWMDGDDLACIHDNGFTYPYDDGNSAHCLGHAAHEFGHVLGLDHTGPNEDCMRYAFYTDDPSQMCDFGADNVAQILADPDNVGWLEALPGDTCVGL